jgi:hypothetical protein
MTIERNNNEIIIRLPGDLSTDGLQRLINFLLYKEATQKSKATQEEVNQLASEVNKNWWEKNKDRFLK